MEAPRSRRLQDLVRKKLQLLVNEEFSSNKLTLRKGDVLVENGVLTMTHLGILAQLAAAAILSLAASAAAADCPEGYTPCGQDKQLCCPSQ